MEDCKKIVVKIWGLIVDIFILGISTIKHIALPGKSNKGNILSSILIFFIGLIERLYLFEHGFFRMTNIFKLKYVRNFVVIIAVVLFILASFECTIPGQDNSVEAGIELFSTITSVKDVCQHRLNIAYHLTKKGKLIAENPCTQAAFTSPLKKYLFTHILLI